MFQKISNEDHFNKIRQGDWIVKYPLTGTRADEIDLSDERFFMLYEVYIIDPASGMVQLKNLDVPAEDQNQKTSHPSTTQKDGLTLLQKQRDDLIADGVWWHRP